MTVKHAQRMEEAAPHAMAELLHRHHFLCLSQSHATTVGASGASTHEHCKKHTERQINLLGKQNS